MFTLPSLPYSYDALEPYIDQKTMEIHHTKHHQGYIDKLNAALENHADLQDQSVEVLLESLDSLPESVRPAVRNHGGGHVNHSLFWQVLKPKGANDPTGDLATALNTAFGSFNDFKDAFSTAAAGHFGSGWAWLTLENSTLHVCTTSNQDSVLSKGNTPILGLDVWEHAYYLKYQNRRAEYIDSFWNLVDWNAVAQNFKSAT
jgi:Fe-Mn family superoxide dismutase